MPSSKSGTVRKTFLEKLYDILQTSDPSIISWNPKGTVILINDKERLSSEVLGKYFRSNQFESFVRQLSFYQFRRTGLDKLNKNAKSGGVQPIMEFINDKFTRDKPNLGLTIKRKTYGVDDVKEEVLELKSEVSKLKDDMKSVKSSVKDLSSKFDDIRHAMWKMLQNQQQLHSAQQKLEKNATSGDAAADNNPPVKSDEPSTIPPKPFGAKTHSLDAPTQSFGDSSTSAADDSRQPSIGSFNLGSQTWNEALNSPAPDGAAELDSEGLGNLFSTYFDDDTLEEGQGVELLVPLDGSNDNSKKPASSRAEYRVPVQPKNKRLRGRGASAIHDGTMGPPADSNVGSTRRIQIGDGLATADEPLSPAELKFDLEDPGLDGGLF